MPQDGCFYVPLRCGGVWVGARVEAADHARRNLAGCTLLLRDVLTHSRPAAGAGAGVSGHVTGSQVGGAEACVGVGGHAMRGQGVCAGMDHGTAAGDWGEAKRGSNRVSRDNSGQSMATAPVLAAAARKRGGGGGGGPTEITEAGRRRGAQRGGGGSRGVSLGANGGGGGERGAGAAVAPVPAVPAAKSRKRRLDDHEEEDEEEDDDGDDDYAPSRI